MRRGWRGRSELVVNETPRQVPFRTRHQQQSTIHASKDNPMNEKTEDARKRVASPRARAVRS